MKTKTVVTALVVAFLSVTSVFGQTKTEKFKVYGNCGMCETRIENAAKSVDGVTAADWNKDTKMLEVSFDESKTNVNTVDMAVAKVGHDTDKHKAEDAVYTKLPGCCKYDRTKAKSSSMP